MSQTGLDKVIISCHQTLECRQLRKAVKWICLHPICNSFQDMCDSCYSQHMEYHHQNKLSYEADLSNHIIKFDKQKEIVEQILNKVTTELNSLKEKINSQIINFSTNNEKESVDPIIQELISIKEQVDKEFDDLIDHLKYKSHQNKSNKIKSLFEEVRQKLQETKEYTDMMNQPEMVLQSVRDVSLFDFEYQTQIQKARMEQILDECMKNDERQIDDDIALRLLSNLKKDLQNIILKPTIKKTQKFNIKNQLENNFQIKNWLFYFEPYTKNFHYIDVKDAVPAIKTIPLDINFQIQPGNRSTLSSNNHIYLVGGYDPNNINLENEEHFKYVYKLNLDKRILQKVSCLITLRHSFGLCHFQNSLYVIGGYNYIEGSLAKCEKIPLEDGYQSSIPINNLQKRSSHLTVTSWNNSILVKFGGILIDQNIPAQQGKIGKQIVVSDNLTEYYVPENDYWVQMQTLNYPSTFLSCSIEVNNQLFIFGGLSVNFPNQKNNQVQDIISPTNILIKMKAFNIETLDIEIQKTTGLHDSFYTLYQPILKELSNSKKKRIYFLAQDSTDYKNPNIKPTLKWFDI